MSLSISESFQKDSDFPSGASLPRATTFPNSELNKWASGQINPSCPIHWLNQLKSRNFLFIVISTEKSDITWKSGRSCPFQITLSGLHLYINIKKNWVRPFPFRFHIFLHLVNLWKAIRNCVLGNKKIIFVAVLSFFLGGWSDSAVLKCYPWFCTQELLLASSG